MNNNDEIYLNDVVMEEKEWKKNLKFSQAYKHKKMLMHMREKKFEKNASLKKKMDR